MENTTPGADTQTSKERGLIIKSSILAMQVCVPNDWNEEDVIAFAEKENPCGTTSGWKIAREGNEALLGSKERVSCANSLSRIHYLLIA